MSQAPAVDRPGKSGNSTGNARRDELADLLFGYIGGLKRRLMASVPDELKGEFGGVTWHQVGRSNSFVPPPRRRRERR